MNINERTGRVAVPIESKTTNYEVILTETAGFNQMDINSLIDLIISKYHFNARKNVAIIYDLAQKVFSSEREKHPELSKLVEAMFLFFDNLLFHLKKEEQILFPNIIQLTEKKLHERTTNYSTFGIIQEYASIMQNEHRDVMRQLEFFRQLTNDYRLPPNCSEAYQSLVAKMKDFDKDMIRHIQIENDFLFPKAIRMDEAEEMRK